VVIEKIEENTDVAYALVLYTACDLGRAKTESKSHPRARQNVVFEHGYLIAKLGRERVAAILRERGCTVLPSETNFLFVQPAVITAEALFTGLREAGIITRYFPYPRISQYLRITIGTDAEMDALLAEAARLDK
jgi:histidinol-phosphate/aromatic aminotransferase/cobyric acid decarboxylase-like protein